MAGRASLGGASAPRSLPGGVSRPRRSARAFASGAHAPGSIADWVERELDFGDVSRVSSQGGSAWASFSTLETTSGKRLFVKTSRSGPEMFAGEGAGLRAMHAACVVEDEDSSSSDSSSSTMVIPEVHFAGATPEGCRDGNSCIVMDHLDFGARGDQAAYSAALGKAEARGTRLEEELRYGARKSSFSWEMFRAKEAFLTFCFACAAWLDTCVAG